VSVREYREIEAGEQVPSWETWDRISSSDSTGSNGGSTSRSPASGWPPDLALTHDDTEA